MARGASATHLSLQQHITPPHPPTQTDLPTFQRRKRIRPSDRIPLQNAHVVVGGDHDAERVLVGWLEEVLVASAV